MGDIDGRSIAREIEQEVTRVTREVAGKLGRSPCLHAILASDDPASRLYVARKREACERVGIRSILSECGSPEELRSSLRYSSGDAGIDGILLQLPLPPSYGDPCDYFELISELKDCDGFNPANVGLLMQGKPRFLPCTAQAIRIILSEGGVSLRGKHVCVINRSNVVGKPLSAMLIQDDATVTVCHDCTPRKDLVRICRDADVLVVAVGIPGFLTCDMTNSGQTVIDVGVSRVGGKVVGDVDPSVYGVVERHTLPVGGVGPVTVACLLINTLHAAKLNFESKPIYDAFFPSNHM